MSLSEPKVRCPWSLARWAWSFVVVAWTVEIARLYYAHPMHPGLDFATSVVVDGVYGGLWWAARRETRQRAAVVAKEAVEAAALRTPRAPDAGPDQCPVCAMADLDELAADDRLMERGPDRCKVVPYGSRRAHRDCAEMAPYTASVHFDSFEVDGHKTYCACKQCEPWAVEPGAYYRCTFCGFYRRAAGWAAAKEKLIAHAKECPKRPTAKSVKAQFGRLEVDLGRVAAEIQATAGKVEARGDEPAWLAARFRRPR